ncbi:MAG: PQQ-binding-like beta-propeller repeat protein [Anaerolineales bacterium]|nr:PQQ-binding-like beta-propeller repeat protein [Anaerolineales bacterium]
MNTKRLILISMLALLGSLVLSACSGGRTVSNNWHGLAADAERAYLSNGSFVYAIDVKTGNQIWQYPAAADSKLLFYAAPVLTADGQLLIGSAGTNHPFISLDPATGKEKWAESFTKSKAAWLASPLVFDNTSYAPNTDGFLYILDMNGKESAAPIELGGALWSAPTTDGKSLYVTSLDHHVHIIDPANSAANKSIDLGGAAPSSPVIADGGAYVGSFASTVEFIASDGGHKVVAKAENWIWGSPVLDGATLYYADLKGNIVSFDVASGKQNWNAAQKDDAVVASLLVAGDQIYVATESGNFIALDREGKIVWEKTVGGSLYTAPVVSGDSILVAPYQAEFALAAYDKDGKQAWTFTPAK